MEKGRLIGRGRRADIFEFGEGRVLKLLKPSPSLDAVRNEARNMELARAAGLPVPRVFEVTEVDGRPGIVYEHIKGVSMDRCIKAALWRTAEFARRMADLHVRVHRAVIPGIRDVKQRLWSKVLRSGCSEEVREQLLHRLDALPDGNTLLHFDFHPLNLVLSGSEIYIIDWDNMCAGDPIADMARTCLISFLSENHFRPGPERTLVRYLSRVMRDTYVKRYTEVSGVDTRSLSQWLSVLAAERMTEGFPEEMPVLERLTAAKPS